MTVIIYFVNSGLEVIRHLKNFNNHNKYLFNHKLLFFEPVTKYEITSIIDKMFNKKISWF